MTQRVANALSRPLPYPQPESDFYWQKCKQHELWLRWCKDCNRSYFYPRDICPECFSRNTHWVKSSGRATLHTFAVVHRAPIPALRDRAPYVVAIVELEGGARLPTSLVRVEKDPKALMALIGKKDALEVAFEDVSETISLPVFGPAQQ
ncbi:MAG: OB-fold domain-containing protein [Chloroflexi bacterium]|nr:OB-fold domain-containing protein [Chloroflexota bacterium]